MKRRRRGEEDEKDTKKKSKFIEQCSTKFNRPWSDLDQDLLGEIKKKLYGADYIRFSSVCKSWKAAQHGTRAADVLPWLMVIDREHVSKMNYYLFEPSAPHLSPVISDSIYLDRFFDISRLDLSFSFVYRDGCLFLSMPDTQANFSYFLLLTLPTKKVITIPPLHYLRDYRAMYKTSRCKLFTAVSTNPTSPDCIFLAFHYTNDNMHEISTFRHGDANWRTTEDDVGWFGFPCTEDFVFSDGIFYFLLSDGRLGYIDPETRGASYINLQWFDWSHEVWVPLQSLGKRSLFLSSRSAYVDATNFYGVSASKIYVRRDRFCYVYSLKNGRMSKCNLSGLRNWDGLDYKMKSSVWVEPHVFLPKSVPALTSQGLSCRAPVAKRFEYIEATPPSLLQFSTISSPSEHQDHFNIIDGTVLPTNFSPQPLLILSWPTNEFLNPFSKSLNSTLFKVCYVTAQLVRKVRILLISEILKIFLEDDRQENKNRATLGWPLTSLILAYTELTPINSKVEAKVIFFVF
ncbi:hypothetical protein POM88_005651 [Heracleum sosnowskyi]|uniref:KIB1-4 beta-propeller domain-containing protein n=1 Tax=Heracleum sosnowskyi TaxID=360622 RepID=A0AAD8J387_9APIA|nr:hypothetical protein POM88_005651 [Heracleum sosnowskyi]